MKAHTKIRYARTITSTHSFAKQDNLLRFNPTVYYMDVEKMFDLAKEFLALQTDEDVIFYILGHTYELDCVPEKHWENSKNFVS